MKRLIAIIIPCVLLFGGCRREPSVGEQVIVTGIGINEQDGVWIVSVQAVDALKTAGSLSEQDDSATAVYTTSGDSVATALQNFLNEVGKRTYILQNKIIVVNESLSRRQSMQSILDYFIRGGEGRALVDVVICRGDPSALLGITTGNDAIPADYIAQLLKEGNLVSKAVKTRLLDVERAASGMYDLTAPVLQVEDRTPQLVGTAVFRDGIWRQHLTEQETIGLLAVSGEGTRCLYTVDDTTVRLEDLRVQRQTEQVNKVWRYRFTVTGIADIVEDGHGRQLSMAQKQQVLHRVQTALSADAESALERICAEGCDPLGLARTTAARYRRDGITQGAVRVELPYSHIAVSSRFSLYDK